MPASLALMLLSCSSDGSGSPATPSAPENGPAGLAPPTASLADPPPTATATPSAGDACAGIKARFEQELAAAPGTCKADADCDCFPGAVADGHVCGGITDKATAAKLHDIFREFRAAKCRGPNCAPQACKPQCKDGRCTERR